MSGKEECFTVHAERLQAALAAARRRLLAALAAALDAARAAAVRRIDDRPPRARAAFRPARPQVHLACGVERERDVCGVGENVS